MFRKTIFLALGIVMTALFFIVCHHGKLYQKFWDWVGDIDREYYEKMESVKIGMDRDHVIRLLGKPDIISREPEITETHGKYGSGDNYGIRIRNRNECLIYHHGIDVIAHYFIDENGKVYFINVGGT